MNKKTPLRMCIICKSMLPKSELIRVVKSPLGEIIIDTTGKKSGRGAYICTNELCIKKCAKSKAVSRNYKTEVDKEIYQEIENEYNRKK